MSLSEGRSSQAAVSGKGRKRFRKGQEVSLAEWFFPGSLAEQQRKHDGAQSHLPAWLWEERFEQLAP